MERQLKFNPYYYRILTPEEIEAAEKAADEQDLQDNTDGYDDDEEEEKKDFDDGAQAID